MRAVYVVMGDRRDLPRNFSVVETDAWCRESFGVHANGSRFGGGGVQFSLGASFPWLVEVGVGMMGGSGGPSIGPDLRPLVAMSAGPCSANFVGYKGARLRHGCKQGIAP